MNHISGTALNRPTKRPDGQSVTFAALDGLRGIAAIAVAVRHAPFLWLQGFPVGIFHESYLAVDFFFVLSGFVIAHAYESRLRSGMSVRQFMIARFVRLYPLYLLAIAISLILPLERMIVGKANPTDFADYLYNLTFLPSVHSKTDLFPVNIPAWSLFFELVVNFVFGTIGKRLNNLILTVIVSVSALTLMIAVPSGWLGFGAGHGPMDAGAQWSGFSAGLARVTFSFFAGVLALRLWKLHPAKRSLPPLALVAILCAILMSYPPAEYQVAYDLFATIVVFPVLVFVGANTAPQKAASRLFKWLGSISYGVYVIQLPAYDIDIALGRLIGNNDSKVSVICGMSSVISVILLAWVTYHHFDLPVRQALAGWGRRRMPERKLARVTPAG